MNTAIQPTREFEESEQLPGFMKAHVFAGNGRHAMEEKPIPRAGTGEAVIRVRLTSICGTDIHIVKGEYPVKRGLMLGHEAVAVIHALGEGVPGYQLGERVLVGAITPCDQSHACLSGHAAQCCGAPGGWNSPSLTE